MPFAVLIVDDDKAKRERLAEEVAREGVSVECIHFAETTNDARNRLEGTSYDLMILDIALPKTVGGQVLRDGGIGLLEELTERRNFRLPGIVIGLTGFEDLFQRYGETFRSRLWAFEHYRVDSNEWRERVRARVRYAVDRLNDANRVQYKTDLCVVTGLHDPELAALRTLDWRWSAAESLEEIGYFYQGEIAGGAKSKSVVAAAAPRMGMIASAILSTKMILKFRPRILAMVGVCAGVRDKCNIGDVLLADPSWNWQYGKIEQDDFSFAPDQCDVDFEVVERFRKIADDQAFWEGVHRSLNTKAPENRPRLQIGPVASGSAVLADGKTFEAIAKQHRKLLGADMELYGMYAAARDSQAPRPLTFGLKSVCDFGDKDKADNYQVYASMVSVETLKTFCDRFLDDFVSR